jgi:hypothetical protein
MSIIRNRFVMILVGVSVSTVAVWGIYSAGWIPGLRPTDSQARVATTLGYAHSRVDMISSGEDNANGRVLIDAWSEVIRDLESEGGEVQLKVYCVVIHPGPQVVLMFSTPQTESFPVVHAKVDSSVFILGRALCITSPMDVHVLKNYCVHLVLLDMESTDAQRAFIQALQEPERSETIEFYLIDRNGKRSNGASLADGRLVFVDAAENLGVVLDEAGDE